MAQVGRLVGCRAVCRRVGAHVRRRRRRRVAQVPQHALRERLALLLALLRARPVWLFASERYGKQLRPFIDMHTRR